MKYFRQMLTFALMVALALGGPCAAAEETGQALTLPGMLTQIGDEAFYGNTSLDRIVLPEGLLSIGSRAFADIGQLSAINLPQTITLIAGDAFSGTSVAVVAAPAGSYAHQRAIEIGLLMPLTLSIEAVEGTAEYEEPMTWTAAGEGGRRPHQYTFTLYRNGEPYESEEIPEQSIAGGDDGGSGGGGTSPSVAASEAVYTYTFVRPGEYYVLAVMTDENGDTTDEFTSPVVTLEGPNVIQLDSTDGSFKIVKAHTWTALAEGGVEPYEYKFTMESGDAALYTRGFSEKETLHYTFFDPGSYRLTVQAKDANGVLTKPKTIDIVVASSNVTIKGVVRIYVDIDSSNRVLKTNAHTGHYELQINNSENNRLAIDDRIYINPAFSFESSGGSGTPGIIAVSNGDQILRASSRLYTFSFSTTAAKLKTFINNLFTQYLDIENETGDETWTRYSVTSGPFQTYNIQSSNCFTAVAAWSKWLGYNTLYNIASSSSSYTNYIAWRMLERYGSSWTYVGRKN